MFDLLEKCRKELCDFDREFKVVCRDSTPVFYFGNLRKAEVVTVGYNPSIGEFFDGDGLALTD